MADANITKKALASALKELMKTTSFEKTTVGDICKACGMNRKSFYYHFKDKYDLANWIYFTEFISEIKSKDYASSWMFFEDMCVYFSENKNFYRKLFRVQEQNSFSEYFLEFLRSVLRDYVREIYQDTENIGFYTDFYADAIFSAINRWLLSRNNGMPPEKFVSLVHSCLIGSAAAVLQEAEKPGSAEESVPDAGRLQKTKSAESNSV